MRKKSNIIYVGAYFDIHGRDVLNDKKIGVTTDDVKSRKRDLTPTKSPMGYVMLNAWKVGPEADKIEKVLHNLLEDRKSHGEWFFDDDDTVVSKVQNFMETLGLFGASIEEMDLDEKEVIDGEERSLSPSESKTVRKRRARKKKIKDEYLYCHFSGRTLTQSLYGRGIVLRIGDKSTEAFFEGEEDRILSGGTDETYYLLAKEAHAEDPTRTSNCAPNLSKMKLEDGELLGNAVDKLDKIYRNEYCRRAWRKVGGESEYKNLSSEIQERLRRKAEEEMAKEEKWSNLQR